MKIGSCAARSSLRRGKEPVSTRKCTGRAKPGWKCWPVAREPSVIKSDLVKREKRSAQLSAVARTKLNDRFKIRHFFDPGDYIKPGASSDHVSPSLPRMELLASVHRQYTAQRGIFQGRPMCGLKPHASVRASATRRNCPCPVEVD